MKKVEFSWLLEFGCWTVVALAPLLHWINGGAVSADQYVVRIALIALALGGAVTMRVKRCLRSRRQRKVAPNGLETTAPTMNTANPKLGASSLLRAATLAAACGIVGCAWIVIAAMPGASAQKRSYVPSDAPQSPYRIQADSANLLQLSSEDQTWLRAQVQPPSDGSLSPSLCLHLLRLHGIDKGAELPSGRSSSHALLLDILLDEELGAAFFGEPALRKTRHGVRFASHCADPRSQEAHRDQCLATLGELGIPLSHPLLVDGDRLNVRDLLNDSIAAFHLGQEELAWTAQAYALYLPPARKWSNCFDERFSFDDLATELLKRPVNDAPCFGMHLITSLTIIAQADRRGQLLSGAVRSSLLERLVALVAACGDSQQPDGSWAFDWYLEVAPHAIHPHVSSSIDTPHGRLLMTSHVAEWLLVLPAEMQVSAEVRRRAAQWLFARLRRSDATSQLEQFCLYTHAAHGVRQWSQGRGPGSGTCPQTD